MTKIDSVYLEWADYDSFNKKNLITAVLSR